MRRACLAAGSVVLSTAAAVGWRQYRRTVTELDAVAPASPVLPGSLHAIPTPWGVVAYRLVTGSSNDSPLVVIHGWGRTGDSAWWPLLWETDRTVVVVDLPGHGRSALHEPFQFRHAADAVRRAVTDAGVERPILVGHSMGGPVALHVLAEAEEGEFGGLVMAATSAFWAKPKLWVTVAAAPFAMAPRSPIVVRRARAEMELTPDRSSHIRWRYSSRPHRSLLTESAAALRNFDARDWKLHLPPAIWLVATDDGIIHPRHQHASARWFGIPTVEVDSDHAVVINAPHSVLAAVADVETRMLF